MKFLSLLMLIVAFSITGIAQSNSNLNLGHNIGAPISDPNPITFSTLLSEIEKQDTIHIQLRAKVEAVCQVKGCWMNLVPVDGSDNASVFVKFKDYAFFMPLDLAGQEVIVDGIAYKEITTVEELRHYAEDEGKSPEEIAQITSSAEELKFMADGVIILTK